MRKVQTTTRPLRAGCRPRREYVSASRNADLYYNACISFPLAYYLARPLPAGQLQKARPLFSAATVPFPCHFLAPPAQPWLPSLPSRLLPALRRVRAAARRSGNASSRAAPRGRTRTVRPSTCLASALLTRALKYPISFLCAIIQVARAVQLYGPGPPKSCAHHVHSRLHSLARHDKFARR